MANHEPSRRQGPLSRSYASHPALNSIDTNQAWSLSISDEHLEIRDSDFVRTDVYRETSEDNSHINLSYCGCGFLGMYHLGVASAIQQYAPRLSVHRISGVSAGSLVAVAHLCGNLQLADALTAFLEVAIDARSRSLGPLHPAFNIQKSVEESLDRFLPDDIHLKATGRLHVSLTRVRDGSNVIVNQFDSKQDVISAILCSCFIPIFSGMIAPKFKGVRYVDGGFSNNQIILDEKTITVSPFFGECDICPQDPDHGLVTISYSGSSIVLTPRNLYRIGRALIPWSPDFLFNQCEQGFSDAIRYLQQTNLISCTRCMTIQFDIRNNIQINEISSDTIAFGSTNTSKRPKFRRRSFIVYTRKTNIILHDLTLSSNRCNDCDQVHRGAPNQPLPVQFNEIFDQICDQLNRSLLNWLYSHRPIYFLSCMALPYYLPVDLSLVALNRSICFIMNSFRFVVNNCGRSMLELIQELMITLISSGLVKLSSSEISQIICHVSGSLEEEISVRELIKSSLYSLKQVTSHRTIRMKSRCRKVSRRSK